MLRSANWRRGYTRTWCIHIDCIQSRDPRCLNQVTHPLTQHNGAIQRKVKTIKNLFLQCPTSFITNIYTTSVIIYWQYIYPSKFNFRRNLASLFITNSVFGIWVRLNCMWGNPKSFTLPWCFWDDCLYTADNWMSSQQMLLFLEVLLQLAYKYFG